MSFRLSTCFRMCLAMAVFGWGGLLAGTVLGQEKPTAPTAEASGQTSPATNAAVAGSRAPRNGLMRLEEQLSRSFQFLKPSSSLEGVPAPPLPARAASPLLNKRAKEALERRKNWMFPNPNDPASAPTLEDMLNLPQYGSDGTKKKPLPSVENFYQDLERKRTAKTKRDPFAPDDQHGLRNGLSASQESASEEDPSLPGAVRNTEKQLRKLLGTEGSSFAPASVHGSFLDIFGQGERTLSPADELAHKAYMKEFQQWLDRSSAPPGGSPTPFGAPAVPGQAVFATTGLNALAPPSRPDNYDPHIGAANPTLLVSTPQDISAKVLNQWNPLYAPPRVEPPKTAPPAPNFDVPRRKF